MRQIGDGTSEDKASKRGGKDIVDVHTEAVMARRREVASPWLDAVGYLEAWQDWRNGCKGWQGLESCLENKAKSIRQVSPKAVAATHGAVLALIQKGVSNGVVYPAQLQQACMSFAGFPGILSGK